MVLHTSLELTFEGSPEIASVIGADMTFNVDVGLGTGVESILGEDTDIGIDASLGTSIALNTETPLDTDADIIFSMAGDLNSDTVFPDIIFDSSGGGQGV